MRKIGIVTTGRCDYGIYRSLIDEIQQSPDLELRLYVTGMHLSKLHGYTLQDILDDGIKPAAEIPVDLTGDSPLEIGRAMGALTGKFAEAFSGELPDILFALGDRFEMHAAVVAAVPFNVIIAHIHGGELTYGAIDDVFRHSLTKLSHLHFTSTKEYARRVIQMGERPETVFVSGAPGLDQLLRCKKLDTDTLGERYAIDFSLPIMLVTFHPVTREPDHNLAYIKNLIEALREFKTHNIIFTGPNADPGSQIIRERIRDAVERYGNFYFVNNFGIDGFANMLRQASILIGNSSSGIIEAASYQLPVVNIGSRQDGRSRGPNVIDCDYSAAAITETIARGLSATFKSKIRNLENPYGQGRAGKSIVAVIKQLTEMDVVKKFYDLERT